MSALQLSQNNGMIARYVVLSAGVALLGDARCLTRKRRFLQEFQPKDRDPQGGQGWWTGENYYINSNCSLLVLTVPRRNRTV